MSGNLPPHQQLTHRNSSGGQLQWSEPWRRRRARQSSEPHKTAQRKSGPWPLMPPVQQLRRRPGSCSHRQRTPLKRVARKSRNRHPASKRRLDVPQSVRLAGAAVQPADANAPQDGQALGEGRHEKERRRSAGQSAGHGSFVPGGVCELSDETHDVIQRT